MDIDITDVQAVCAAHHIEIRAVQAATGSFGKLIFFINGEYLLRLSASPMDGEQEKYRRVTGLDHVPRIVAAGAHARAGGPLYYTLLTLLPGRDIVDADAQTTPAQQERLGAALAAWIDRLHEIRGAGYDIGPYVPAVANFGGTWRAGHEEYWRRLRQQAAALGLRSDSRAAFERAFGYLAEHSPALDFQAGPILLHNDLHPKNILLRQGRLSGVIDWECAQFGEADYDLCHVIHWSLYPPQPGLDFRPLLRGLLAARPRCAQVPHLARRLTIYQIEHDIQQMLWQPAAEAARAPRLDGWVDGAVERLLGEVGRPVG